MKPIKIILATLVPLYAGLASAEPVSELRIQFESEAKLLDAPLSTLNSKYREYLEAGADFAVDFSSKNSI